MSHLLDNPVYNALITGDQHLGFGKGKVRAFDAEVSPFAGFEEGYDKGFDDLYALLPPRAYILYANPKPVEVPRGWRVVEMVQGVQMIFDKAPQPKEVNVQLTPLSSADVDEMIQLAQLTKPGPFSKRTIEFGHYFGIIRDNKLVAMAGQRMHVPGFTEISAVCTHPNHLGQGYAAALVQHQLNLIFAKHDTPFLHVRGDNSRAIALYERLGFKIRGPMYFYFLRKESSQ